MNFCAAIIDELLCIDGGNTRTAAKAAVQAYSFSASVPWDFEHAELVHCQLVFMGF